MIIDLQSFKEAHIRLLLVSYERKSVEYRENITLSWGEELVARVLSSYKSRGRIPKVIQIIDHTTKMRAFLILLVSIAQVSISLHILSATIISISLAPYILVGGAEETVETATDKDTDNENGDTKPAVPVVDPNKVFEQIYASNGDRVISSEELSIHIEKEYRIWLSILGKVYDVTDGEDFYGALKGSYKFYSGRDASPCFSSGINTPEGAVEKLEEWEDKKLMPVWEWSEFYQNHETYKYLGVLGGSRYYDIEGNELQLRKDIISRSEAEKKKSDEEREAKRKKRLADREARKKKKEEGMLEKRREAAEKAKQNSQPEL